jgi:hypothetical protein
MVEAVNREAAHALLAPVAQWHRRAGRVLGWHQTAGFWLRKRSSAAR